LNDCKVGNQKSIPTEKQEKDKHRGGDFTVLLDPLLTAFA